MGTSNKSSATIGGWPLLHVCAGIDPVARTGGHRWYALRRGGAGLRAPLAQSAPAELPIIYELPFGKTVFPPTTVRLTLMFMI
jgi:hypothetical protein